MFEIDPKLINAPKTLRELVNQYKSKRNMLDKKEQDLEKPETNVWISILSKQLSSQCTHLYCCTYNSDYHTNYNIYVIQTI